MDTSEIYIKISKKAEEIQNKKLASMDDFSYCLLKEENYFVTGEYIHQNSVLADKYIWLPRQDQLQKMIDWKRFGLYINWNTLPHRFEWKNDPLCIKGMNGNSMEQLWLSFTMKEKYHKIWDGNNWVKE